MAITRIAGAALNQTPLDWQGNLRHIKQAIKMAKEAEVKLLCLPELCITGYGCEDLFLSKWLPEKVLSFLPEIASWCKDIDVVVGLPIAFGDYLYNCACMISDGAIQGFYAKQFMALDGVHYEPRWFRPWPSGKKETIEINGETYPLGDVTFQLREWHVGFEICEDAWHENERPACRLLGTDVNLILNPSASHFALSKSAFRESLVSNSSRKFGCTYLYANLLGNESGRMIFDGEILISQKGSILARNERLSFKEVNLVYADVDTEQKLPSQSPFQYDTHDEVEEFTLATTLALYDYCRKSRSKGFILSLSGGADSSACAVLVAETVKRGLSEVGRAAFLEKTGMTQLHDEMQGLSEAAAGRLVMKHWLTTAYQGTVNSSEDTYLSAKELADNLGATFYHWKIDEEVASYTAKIEKSIGRKLTWEQDDITLQNIQARARSPIIWMLANLNNALLLTTSNRSEGDVGYATMDGDTSGSIGPIAGIDKYFLLQWLRYAQKELGYTGLQRVNSLTPSAELRPPGETQTDEKDLMPYAMLVAIERLAIRDHLSPVQVYHALRENHPELSPKVLKDYITKFFRLWSRNQWKRERLAPSFHLDDFNVDPRTWARFPILSGGFSEELKALDNA
ncbi:NAD(+) synthase [Roseivirga sp. BDSF3-8]|uniref:NAD(+) synthase n=1 Tax=Roseivirga sp. BDSF3-8 TaxID=3241598 RepID=UPI0035320561